MQPTITHASHITVQLQVTCPWSTTMVVDSRRTGASWSSTWNTRSELCSIELCTQLQWISLGVFLYSLVVISAEVMLPIDCMYLFYYLCNTPLIWLCTSHSAIRPLARNPMVTEQLDKCACLPYRLRHDLLERHAERAAALHQDDTAFYPRGRCQMLLYTLCLAADFPRCSCDFPVSDLHNDMSPDPARSNAATRDR